MRDLMWMLWLACFLLITLQIVCLRSSLQYIPIVREFAHCFGLTKWAPISLPFYYDNEQIHGEQILENT